MASGFSLDNLVPGLEKLKGELQLKVGVLAGASDARGVETPVAEYAAYNEFGARIKVTPKMRGFMRHKGVYLKGGTEEIEIPARSFLRDTLDLNQERYLSGLAAALDDNLDPEAALELVGETIEGDVKQAIESWQTPPNAPLTIAWKGENAPLKKTGTLAGAINHHVERRS